jgi:hypothetical protein
MPRREARFRVRGWPKPPDESEPDIFDLLEEELQKEKYKPFRREHELSLGRKPSIAVFKMPSEPNDKPETSSTTQPIPRKTLLD